MSITAAQAIAARYGWKALKSVASKWWAKRTEKRRAKRKARRALKAARSGE